MNLFLRYITFFLFFGLIFPFLHFSYSDVSEDLDQTLQQQKPKSYTERYKDFYKDYSKNYKERYKPGNYQKYYHQLNRENHRYSGYGFTDRSYYDPEQIGENETVQETPLNEEKGNTPTLPAIPLNPENDSRQLLPNFLQPLPRQYNPFQGYPGLVPPHLLHPASQSTNATAVVNSTESDEALPRETREEAPAFSNISDSTSSQESSTTEPPPPQIHLSPAQVLYNSGVTSFAQRNYIVAGQTFEKLVQMAPQSVYAQFAYALSQFFSTEYKNSLTALRTSFELAQTKKVSLPKLWQLSANPIDFRFHYQKLARYVNRNPQDHEASELLLMFAKTGTY